MPPTETRDPAALLAGAAAARSRPVESAEAMARALEAAPDDPDIRLAAYRFYFYTHDHHAAREQAEFLIVNTARRLNIATDWSIVGPDDADFAALDPVPGLYLQALVALGYCAARTGAIDDARAVLTKASDLDPADRFGGAWLLGHMENALAGDEAE